MTARIVLVEDDPDIAALIQEVLSDDGHQVDLRTSLDEGAPDPSVDLVITDLVVLRAYDPMTARGWVARVRARFPKARVVVSTAHATAAEEGAPNLGADAVMPKPFDINALTTTVDALLAG